MILPKIDKKVILKVREELLQDTLHFTRFFYKERTGRDFLIALPVSRRSHQIVICEALKDIELEKYPGLVVNTPGRSGKTEIMCHWVAQMFAKYPDSRFLYISVTHNLATEATALIREIMRVPMYRHIFGVELKEDSQAKNHFQTRQGGSIEAIGAGGAIVGKGAGLMGVNRFGGAIIIDDIIDTEDALSEIVRPRVNNWYFSSVFDRRNNPKTPQFYIGHRTHQEDLSAVLSKMEGWKTIAIKALYAQGTQSFFEQKFPLKELLQIKELHPYTFYSKYQQQPIPDGGALFRDEDFPLLDIEPDFIATFITSDTAETNKSYNDATVFSFFGLYKLKESDTLALHCIDCVELRVEPAQLEEEFNYFYTSCARHKTRPNVVYMEKKSTGVTLLSVLKKKRGLNIQSIDRNVSSGSKNARFMRLQPYIRQKLISLPTNGKHTDMCIEHMKKITANGAQSHDDIADTFYDAVSVGLIDRLVYYETPANQQSEAVAKKVIAAQIKIMNNRRIALWR